MSANDDDGCKLTFESWCRTMGGEEVKFNFVWTIKNFSARPEETGKSLFSSMFNIQAPDDIKSDWKLRLYPKGFHSGYSKFLSVFVCNQSESEVMDG